MNIHKYIKYICIYTSLLLSIYIDIRVQQSTLQFVRAFLLELRLILQFVRESTWSTLVLHWEIAWRPLKVHLKFMLDRLGAYLEHI